MKQQSAKPITTDPISTKGQFTQLGISFRDRRRQLKLSLRQVAQRTGLPAKLYQNLEAGELGAITLAEFTTAALGVGCIWGISLVPQRAPLPRVDGEILSAFDRLITSGRFNPFIRSQPDKEHPNLRWDIVGDVDQNWLYVVVSNPRKKIRYAKVTDNPGSWSIAGQQFGIDVETNAIAGELADQLFQAHKAELLGN